MLLLFFGKSGTGKTMMANALAAMVGKRILLINYPSLGSMEADQVIKFIFREAKLTDAILFFGKYE
jgi:AAA+ superfamily predicted ATPase